MLAPDSGLVVYRATTEGSFMAGAPRRMPTAAGLRQAFGVAVRNLLADRQFAALLDGAGPHRVALGY